MLPRKLSVNYIAAIAYPSIRLARKPLAHQLHRFNFKKEVSWRATTLPC